MNKKQCVENAIASLKLLRKKALSSTERALLLSFPGGGILKECGVFTDADKPQWLKDGRAELQELLDCNEWSSLQNAGMQNAHYTAPGIRQAMWEAIAPILRESDRVLDPGCGIGGFYIEMPKHLNLKYIGVEKDCISSAIAKLAHPEANIYHRDFLNWSYPEKFNLAIGNVPFVNGVSTIEVEGDRLRVGLHAQFFVTAIAHLASGGLLAFLTSVSTLDARTPDYIQFREWVHRKCEFLGAVRLPNQGTHDGGTEVTTDLILLRRRESDCSHEAEWVGVGQSHIVGYDGRPAYLSNWYLTNPQYLIGDAIASKLRGKNGNPTTTFALQPRPNQDVLGELRNKLNLILNKETTMATVIPAEKFKSNSVYAFILRQNPKQSGIEIHFPPDCQMDGDNARQFVTKVMSAGFRQANKNPKLYYATYSEELWQRARSWVQSCKTFDAYELDADEPVEKTPSRRRYGSSATKEVATPPASAPNKLLDALAPRLVEDIAAHIDTRLEPLASEVANFVVAQLKATHSGLQEAKEVTAQLEKQISEFRNECDLLQSNLLRLTEERNALQSEREVLHATLGEVKEERDNLQLQFEATDKLVSKVEAERDDYARQLQELGMLDPSESSTPKFDDESQPQFADESEEIPEPVFVDESQKPKFEDEEEGFDLDELEGK